MIILAYAVVVYDLRETMSHLKVLALLLANLLFTDYVRRNVGVVMTQGSECNNAWRGREADRK